MATKSYQHLNVETAEKYAMGSLPVRKVAEIEEHLLTCETCRQSVAASDGYVAAMRGAAAKLREEQQPQRRFAGK